MIALFFLLLWVSVAATAFPIIYSLTSWHKSVLGRIMMFNAIALAFTLDMTFAFNFFLTSLPEWLYTTIAVVGFSAIGLTKTSLCAYLIIVYVKAVRSGAGISQSLDDKRIKRSWPPKRSS